MTVKKVYLLRYGNTLVRICRKIQNQPKESRPQARASKKQNPLNHKLENLLMYCRQQHQRFDSY